MADNPSLTLFNSINTFSFIEELIKEGQEENQYLECKSPTEPRLTREQKSQLSEAVSGFGNSSGGIILWGVGTTKHDRGNKSLDILSQPEPVGLAKKFAREIDSTIPLLIKPPSSEIHQSKILFKKTTDTRGIIVTYIPPTSGDPVQALDGKFHIRIRHEFQEMPYEIIKRMFAGTDSPDIYPVFDKRIVELKPDDKWKIPIILENRSSAATTHVKVSISIENFLDCEEVIGEQLSDISHVNPGTKFFASEVSSPIYRGLSIVVGNLTVKMKKQKLTKRRLELKITVYASNMRARKRFVIIQLAKKGFSVKNAKDEFLY